MNVRKEVIIRLDGQVYDGHRLQNKVTSRVEDDPLSFKKQEENRSELSGFDCIKSTNRTWGRKRDLRVEKVCQEEGSLIPHFTFTFIPRFLLSNINVDSGSKISLSTGIFSLQANFS